MLSMVLYRLAWLSQLFCFLGQWYWRSVARGIYDLLLIIYTREIFLKFVQSVRLSEQHVKIVR